MCVLITLSLWGFTMNPESITLKYRGLDFFYQLDTVSREYVLYKITYQDSDFVIGAEYSRGLFQITDSTLLIDPTQEESIGLYCLDLNKKNINRTGILFFAAPKKENPAKLVFYSHNLEDSVTHIQKKELSDFVCVDGFSVPFAVEACKIEYFNGATPITYLPSPSDKEIEYYKNNVYMSWRQHPRCKDKKFGLIQINIQNKRPERPEYYRWTNKDTLRQHGGNPPLTLFREKRRIITYRDSNSPNY